LQIKGWKESLWHLAGVQNTIAEQLPLSSKTGTDTDEPDRCGGTSK
jgi:hypothetical protein